MADVDAESRVALRESLTAALGNDAIWTVVDAVPDGVLLVGQDGRIMLVNRRIEDLFGYDRVELVGRPVEQLFVEGLGTDARVCGLRSDGTEVDLEVHLDRITTGDALMVVRPVADEAGSRADPLDRPDVRDLLETTDDAVSILDAETLEFLYVNQGFLDQVGYRDRELRGMTMHDIAPELAGRVLSDSLSAFEHSERASDSFTTMHRRRDGREVPVEIVLHPIRRADGRPHAYVQVARDVSERAEMEAVERRAEQEVRVLEDRERVARDLHDLVIQRLFATGMAAQALRSRVDDPDLDMRLAGIVEELDQTIGEIRTTIFGLTVRDKLSVRGRILDLIREERTALGFAPRLRLDGPIDTIDEHLAFAALAILREMLANVARHAHATSVDIVVSVGEQLVLRVTDDGVGFDSTADRGDGLRNMEHRARAGGGTLRLMHAPQGGTSAECRMPI